MIQLLSGFNPRQGLAALQQIFQRPIDPPEGVDLDPDEVATRVRETLRSSPPR